MDVASFSVGALNAVPPPPLRPPVGDDFRLLLSGFGTNFQFSCLTRSLPKVVVGCSSSLFPCSSLAGRSFLPSACHLPRGIQTHWSRDPHLTPSLTRTRSGPRWHERDCLRGLSISISVDGSRYHCVLFTLWSSIPPPHISRAPDLPYTAPDLCALSASATQAATHQGGSSCCLVVDSGYSFTHVSPPCHQSLMFSDTSLWRGYALI